MATKIDASPRLCHAARRLPGTHYRTSCGVTIRGGSVVTVCTGVGLAGMGAMMCRNAVSICSSTLRRGMHSSTIRMPGS